MGGVQIMTPTGNHVENEMGRAPVMKPTENHVEMKCEYIISYFAAWLYDGGSRSLSDRAAQCDTTQRLWSVLSYGTVSFVQ